jgi:hypothetical protein
MSEIKTLEDLAEIEARANAATEGPWACINEPELSSVVATSMPDTDGKHYGIALIPHWSPECDSIDWNVKADNAKFIAAARTDVPALIAALRDGLAKLDEMCFELNSERAISARLEKRVEQLEEALAEWYLASDDDAAGAETAAHDRLIELATACAWAKQEANTVSSPACHCGR